MRKTINITNEKSPIGYYQYQVLAESEKAYELRMVRSDYSPQTANGHFWIPKSALTNDDRASHKAYKVERWYLDKFATRKVYFSLCMGHLLEI